MEKNNKTLNVPNLRFPEFSGEWEIHKLSEYLDFKNGLNPDAKRFGRGLPFISVMDILADRVICYDNIRAKVEATDKEIECFGVNKGDLLFQRSSETFEDVGRANVYMDNRTAIYGGFVIRGRKIGNYDPLFFKYLLATPLARKRTCRMGAGAQHFNIGQEGLSKISLHFPSIKEQSKIANLFSLIDERVETQKKIIEKYESLIRGLYHSVFNQTASTLQLKDVVSVVKGQQVNGEELLEYGKYYVMNGGTEPSGYLDVCNTPANTISISEGGNSCGYVQYNTEPFWSGGHCYSLIQKEQSVNYQYLYYFLKYKERNIMALRIGSGLPNVQKKDLERFEIRVLPTKQQNRVAEILADVSAKCDLEKRILLGWQCQKSYLLHNLFI